MGLAPRHWRLLAWLCLRCTARHAWAGSTAEDELVLLQTAVPGSESALPTLKLAVQKVPEGQRPLGYETRPAEGSRIDVHQQRYHGIHALLDNQPELAHSSHVVDYVRELAHAPSFVNHTGCLYLPDQKTWEAFYTYLEHPYPPIFAELLARAFFPKCGATSLTGATVEPCEGGIMGSAGPGAAPACLRASYVGESAHGIRVMSVDGVVGLPSRWAWHVAAVDAAGSRKRRGLVKDKCRGRELPPVPPGRRLKVPMKFIVCASTNASMARVTDAMLRQQARWMNEAYAGRSPENRMDFDKGVTPQVDMQMDFELKGIRRVWDADCAEASFVDLSFAGKYNKDLGSAFTVVFIADDSSGILGMSNFPTETVESDAQLLTVINVVGLRFFGRKNPDKVFDLTYDEGDTLCHEGGHGMGLLHTFQGGCSDDGDAVADTAPEAFAHYTCEGTHSCGAPDPVHNFMSYTPDKCMSGFTEMQKRRVWCIMENYRPNLYQASQVHPVKPEYPER